MAVYSDMNNFPESGFPVLSDVSDRIVLNTLYPNPLKPSGFIIDVIGANRLLGALTIGGGLSGVTTIGASGTVTLSSATAPLALTGANAILSMTGANAILSMTGINASIGTNLSPIKKGFFYDLNIKNNLLVNGDPVVLTANLANYVGYIGASRNVGINTTAPDKKLEINSADGNNLRLTYNDADGSATAYVDFLTTSGGDLTITPSGGDISIGTANLGTTGALKGVHKAADGTGAVADGTYTVGIGGTTNGTITIKDGIITAIQQAVA